MIFIIFTIINTNKLSFESHYIACELQYSKRNELGAVPEWVKSCIPDSDVFSSN